MLDQLGVKLRMKIRIQLGQPVGVIAICIQRAEKHLLHGRLLPRTLVELLLFACEAALIGHKGFPLQRDLTKGGVNIVDRVHHGSLIDGREKAEAQRKIVHVFARLSAHLIIFADAAFERGFIDFTTFSANAAENGNGRQK